MAKKRKSPSRRVTVRRAAAPFRLKKKARRSTGSKNSFKDNGAIVGGMVYGGGREYVSDLLYNSPVGDFAGGIFGEFGDEVTMLATSMTLKNGKVPLLNLKVPLVNKLPYHKEIGMAGINIESARLGAALANKFFNKSNGASMGGVTTL